MLLVLIGNRVINMAHVQFIQNNDDGSVYIKYTDQTADIIHDIDWGHLCQTLRLNAVMQLMSTYYGPR